MPVLPPLRMRMRSFAFSVARRPFCKAPRTRHFLVKRCTPTDIAVMRTLDSHAILIVVGVSGSGKTTIATALAQRLGWPLAEGDELYPPAFAKIRAAHPLFARDQWSRLEKVAVWIDDCSELGTGGVITCSALRRSSRDFLTRGR